MLQHLTKRPAHTAGRFLLWGVLCAALPALALEPATDEPEYWLETRLSGTPAGYQHEHVARIDNQATRTHTESRFVLNRMGSQVEIRSQATYREDREGILLHVSAEVGSGADVTHVSADFSEGLVRQHSTVGERSYQTETAIDSPPLGPQGIRQRSRQLLRAVGDRFEYTTFIGDYATLTTAEREVIAIESQGVDGRPAGTIVVREILAALPVPTTIWLDANGRTLRSLQDSPFGQVEAVRTDAAVRQRVAAGADLPEETYQNAVARSNMRLPQPRNIERVRIRLDLERADSTMPALDGPDQTVVEQSARHAIVEVRRSDAPKPGAASNREAGADFLVANAWLQSDHPDVKALAESLRIPAADDYTQARQLQDWVTTNMDFDAGITLVSASEAVRERRGTCLAYAVVLSSLARALDIPSRVVLGYVYTNNMWSGHAWNEVLVDGRWVALDAAVWRAGPADAARFGVARTSLENGMSSGLAELSQLYGNARITVQSHSLNGQEVSVPADQPPYRVDGRRYANPGLGLQLEAPDGFDFAELDLMYPRSEVLVLRDRSGATIALEQRAIALDDSVDLTAMLRTRGFDSVAGTTAAAFTVSGRDARMVRTAEGAAALWRDGADVWLLHGRGNGVDAAMEALLRQGISHDHAP